VHHGHAPGFPCGCHQEGIVQGRNRQEIDDVGLDSVFSLELIGRLQRRPHHRAVSDQGEVLAFPRDHGPANRKGLFLLGHLLAEGAVDGLGLVEDDGVRVADGAGEQNPGVAGAGGDHHLEARDVRPESFAALGVMLQGAHAAAVGRSQDHGDMVPSLGAPAQARGVGFDLVHGVVAETVELHLADRLQPVDGHADGHPDDGGFRERGVHHAPLPEGLDQTVGHAEDAAVNTDVLAQDDDVVVLFHLLPQGQVQGLHHGHLRHVSPPAPRP